MTAFQDGDRIAWIGDSNSSAEADGPAYMQYVHLLYRLRFPNMRLHMFNCGIAGDGYADALKRLDWDILPHQPTHAVIMLGTNDIGYDRYPHVDARGAELGVYPEPIGQAERAACELVNELRQKKIRVTLLLPGGFDERPEHPRGQQTFRGANAALRLLNEKLQRRFAGTDIAVIDLLPTMEHFRAQTPPEEYSRDRVHWRTAVHLFAAIKLLQGQGISLPAAEEETHIRFALTEDQQNALRKHEPVYTDVFPAGYPIPQLDAVKTLQKYGLLQPDSAEQLQISGFPDGQYTIQCNGQTVAHADARQLNDGITIHRPADLPNAVTAGKLAGWMCTESFSPMHDLRRLAYQKSHLRALHVHTESFAACDPNDLAHADPAAVKFAGNRYPVLIDLFRCEEANRRRLRTLWAQADQIGSPQPERWQFLLQSYNKNTVSK